MGLSTWPKQLASAPAEGWEQSDSGTQIRPPHLLGNYSEDSHSPRDGVPRNRCTGTETSARDTAGPLRAGPRSSGLIPQSSRQRASFTH